MFDENGARNSGSGKVDAYPLDSSSENFENLCGNIIALIWLNDSDHPKAIDFRAAQQSGKPRCWRVFHRVTLVPRLNFADPTDTPLENAM